MQSLGASAVSAEIDNTAYETVRDIAALKRWIAEAMDLGAVAVDTETTSVDAMQCELVGVSLATRHGKACYIPLLHAKNGALDTQDMFSEGWTRTRSPCAKLSTC